MEIDNQIHYEIWNNSVLKENENLSKQMIVRITSRLIKEEE